jgi:hypothetical protein
MTFLFMKTKIVYRKVEIGDRSCMQQLEMRIVIF